MDGQFRLLRLPQAELTAGVANSLSHMRQTIANIVNPIEGCKCAVASLLAGEPPPVAATPVAPGNRTAEFWPAAADRQLPRPATLHAPPSPIAETLSRPPRFAVSHPAF